MQQMNATMPRASTFSTRQECALLAPQTREKSLRMPAMGGPKSHGCRGRQKYAADPQERRRVTPHTALMSRCAVGGATTSATSQNRRPDVHPSLLPSRAKNSRSEHDPPHSSASQHLCQASRHLSGQLVRNLLNLTLDGQVNLAGAILHHEASNQALRAEKQQANQHIWHAPNSIIPPTTVQSLPNTQMVQ
eukprot:359159-Chlamydomonas_euryale.AAC.23